MKKLLTILAMTALLSLGSVGGEQAIAVKGDKIKIEIDAERLVDGCGEGREGGVGDLLELDVGNPSGTDFSGLTGEGFFLNICAQPQSPIELTVTGSSISGDTITLTCVPRLDGVVIAGSCAILIELDGPGVVVTVDFPVISL